MGKITLDNLTYIDEASIIPQNFNWRSGVGGSKEAPKPSHDQISQCIPQDLLGRDLSAIDTHMTTNIVNPFLQKAFDHQKPPECLICD